MHTVNTLIFLGPMASIIMSGDDLVNFQGNQIFTTRELTREELHKRLDRWLDDQTMACAYEPKNIVNVTNDVSRNTKDL